MPRLAAILVIVLGLAFPARACTIVSMVQGDRILVGNNEDGAYPFTAVQVLPATPTDHGRICFGFNIGGGRLATLGGVNDQGLFVDGNALEPGPWQPEADQETHQGIVESHVLARFAVVDEALAWFRTTNIPVLARGKFLLADRTGASAVVEWSGNELQIIRTDNAFQVSTNFRQTAPDPLAEPCYRYRTAQAMLEEAEGVSVDLIRQVLSATSFEDEETTTVYSYICDLTDGTVHVYNFHEFGNAVVLDVAGELARGPSYRPLPSLFPRLPFAQHLDAPRRLDSLLQNLAGRKPVAELIGDLDELRDLGLATYGHEYTEKVVDRFGHELLAAGRLEDATAIFSHNVTVFSGSAAACNSLGQAHLARGDTVRAVAEYGRALVCDPVDGEAVRMLRLLQP